MRGTSAGRSDPLRAGESPRMTHAIVALEKPDPASSELDSEGTKAPPEPAIVHPVIVAPGHCHWLIEPGSAGRESRLGRDALAELEQMLRREPRERVRHCGRIVLPDRHVEGDPLPGRRVPQPVEDPAA